MEPSLIDCQVFFFSFRSCSSGKIFLQVRYVMYIANTVIKNVPPCRNIYRVISAGTFSKSAPPPTFKEANHSTGKGK